MFLNLKIKLLNLNYSQYDLIVVFVYCALEEKIHALIVMIYLLNLFLHFVAWLRNKCSMALCCVVFTLTVILGLGERVPFASQMI